MRKETANFTQDSARDDTQDSPAQPDSLQPAEESSLSFADKLRQIWRILWQKPTQVNVFVQPESQSLNTTRQVDLYDRPSGFISGPCNEDLANQVVYPGVKLSLDQLTALLRYNLKLIEEQLHTTIAESDVFFLGFGYEWLPKHARRMQELMEIGIQHSWLNENGSPAIHNLEEHKAFKPLFFKRKLLVGHTLILGTTGSGKTRLFDLLISQAIKRGDAVIVLDPKGDRDLQQGMLKAMRFAGREPINELYCLDVGREVGPRFDSEKGRHYAALSLGQQSNWLESTQDSRPSTLDRLMDGQATALDKVKPGSLLDQNRVEKTPDAYFYEYTNTGINPISAFDSSAEISERICAMMPSEGTAASFKAYAQMAVAAAIDCLILTEQKVSLENIRSLMGNHRRFIDSIRWFLATTVRRLNVSKVSIYFSRIHGVTIPQLQTFAATVPLLLGDFANRSATRKKELNLLQILIEKGLIKCNDDSEKLLQEADKLNELPDVEVEEPTTTKIRRSSRSKSNDGGVHPAKLDDLLVFYNWMVENEYMAKRDEIEGILSISTLPADYFRKVTAGVMPFLGALASGNYSDLLSTPDHKLPSLLDLIEDRKVVYIALQCMRNASTGQALGKLLMSDLAFVASEVTLRTQDKFPNVSIFIDEASELSNEALVQLLNKSRSSHFSVTLATQSEADLVKRTGSTAAAKEVVANCNNVISLRVNDADTASLVSSALPNTVIGIRGSSILTSDNGGFLGDSYMTSRSVQQRLGSLFPASCLKLLPNLEFIANMGVNGVYKGFLPILDYSKNNASGGQRYQEQASQFTQSSQSNDQSTAPAQQADASSAGSDFSGQVDEGISPSLQEQLNAQAHANLDTEEFYRKGGIDPEFESVSKMLDLGYCVYAEEDPLVEEESVQLDSFLEKKPNQYYRNYFVQGS